MLLFWGGTKLLYLKEWYKWKNISGWFGTSYGKGTGNSNIHVLLWWPGKSPPPALWLWEATLRFSSLYCLPGCTCQRDTLPCHFRDSQPAQGGYVVTKVFDGFHLVGSSGSESQWSHKNQGQFCQWPVCAIPVVTDLHFFPSIMHTLLHSAYSPSWHSLLSWYPKERFGPLVGQFLNIFSRLMRLVKKVFGKVLQSHIIVVKEVKTRTGRCRKHRATGWSGAWWQPLSPGGSSGGPARWTWLSSPEAVERWLCTLEQWLWGGLRAPWGSGKRQDLDGWLEWGRPGGSSKHCWSVKLWWLSAKTVLIINFLWWAVFAPYSVKQCVPLLPATVVCWSRFWCAWESHLCAPLLSSAFTDFILVAW